MNKQHVIEQYYSIQVTTPNTRNLYIGGWNGTFAELAEYINKITAANWEKVRVHKYVQTLDMQKDGGSRIVGKKRSLLKIDRVGCGSLCTKVEANFTKNGKIPENILAFFGENQK